MTIGKALSSFLRCRKSPVNTMEMMRQFQSLAWCKPDWCYPSTSKETNELLRQCLNHPSVVVNDDIEDIIKRSKEFPITFPIETVRMHTLKDSVPIEKLKKNVASTYPLIHERVLLLITHFLMYKREFGSTIEKPFYKDMTVLEFIDRLLTKRAITFMGPRDTYKLITGEKSSEGWEQVGTLQQKPPLTLDKVLSYDEIKISSMVYVSGHTAFINDGARKNMGIPSEDIVKDGVIIGLIGPRLERKFRMEYEDILVTEQQNNPENGYGEEVTPTTCLNVLKTTYVRNNQSTKHMWRQMWSEFYQVHSYTHEELTSYVNIEMKNDDKDKYTDRYVKMASEDEIFDNEVYYKRLSVSFDCSLLEANARAAAEGKMAYLNMIGIGLGVWKASTHQVDVFVLTLLERIKWFLKKDLLNNTSDVNIAYVKPTKSIEQLFTKTDNASKIFFESKKHPNGGITVQLQKREPSASLPPEHANKLLVVTYPWDGNAHPGNEFWLGSLLSSGDPAAACSTQVSELHNAHINAAVNAANLRVTTATGLVTIREYCERAGYEIK